MRNTFLILLFFVSCSVFAQRQYSSQNVEVEWGPIEEREKKTTHGDFIGYDETGHYTYRRRKRVDFIAHYDTRMSREKEVALLLPPTDLYRRIEFFAHVKNKLFLVTSETDKKGQQNIIYLETINKTTLQSNKDRNEIGRITGDYYKNMGYSSLARWVSRDESKMLITYNLPKEDDMKHFQAIVINTDSGEKMWEQDIKFNYPEDIFGVRSRMIDNDGTLYFLGTEQRDKREAREDGQQRTVYHMMIYRQDNKFKDFELKLQDKYITEMKVALTDKGDIITAGFYSKKGTNSVDGSFFASIDVEGEAMSKISYKEFSSEFIKQNMTHRQEKKADKQEAKGRDLEMYEYDLDYLIQRDDGGVVLVAEQYYVEQRSYYSASCKCWQTYYIYHYNDIIVVSINPAGEIEWNEKIPKRQAAKSGQNLGYCIGWNQNKIYFVFNDHPANYEGDKKYEGDIATYPGGSAAVVLATVHCDRQGYYELEPMWYSEDVGGGTSPRFFGEQLDDDVIMLFIQGRKRTQRYVKLNLK